ncbi:MAG: FHA domain-containing protein [Bacteroidota bacterium]
MPIKVFVQKMSDDGEPDEYHFEENVVPIGRDHANLLTLPDPKRVISKRHAELRNEAGLVQVVDLGSKNYTFLNGKRIESNRPYDVIPGDTLRMGDFELWMEVSDDTAPRDFDQTVFDAAFLNPFEEDVAELSAVLNRLLKVYNNESPRRRDDALRDALLQASIAQPLPPGAEGARQEVAALLGVTGGSSAPSEPPAAAQPPTPPPMHREPPPAPPRPAAMPPVAPAGLALDAVPETRLARVTERVLAAIVPLLDIPAHFRHEFIGQTIMENMDEAFMRDPASLKKALLDPAEGESDVDVRLGVVEEKIGSLAQHQVAMMEGYKAGVKNGILRLVDALDPAVVREDLSSDNALLRKMGMLVNNEIVKALEEKCQNLRGDDWSAAEQRYYRPEFIRAYLTRMTS